MNNLKVSFFGGVGSVTGANFLCETEGLKFLVDCGLFQGSNEADLENKKPFPYNPATVNFLFVTHAHMDHIGRIPKLVKDGFRGVIYSNPVTRNIAELMLADAYSVMSFESRERGEELLYEQEDIQKCFSLWKTIDYHENLVLDQGFSVTTKDAGHILGSTIYIFKRGEKRMVFTGDLGNSPSPILRDTEEVSDANYLVIESVYGDRNHESKEDRDNKLESVIRNVINNKRVLIIPAFSLERTQVLLYELNKLFESGKLPSIPVFLDSPLAINVTNIYEKVSRYFNPEVRGEIANGDNVFDFKRLVQTARRDESRKIDETPNPKIIIAGSGMSNGGRIIYHESKYLPDERAVLLLIGYQALGTLGRRLQEGEKVVKIMGQDIEVKASVEMIEGYSSHKDSDNLLDFVSDSSETLEKVFVVMGEPKAGMFLSQKIRDNLGVDASYPEKGKEFILQI